MTGDVLNETWADGPDETDVTRDYFSMLAAGVLKEHNRGVWRAFRAGYTRNFHADVPGAPPPGEDHIAYGLL